MQSLYCSPAVLILSCCTGYVGEDVMQYDDDDEDIDTIDAEDIRQLNDLLK